MKTKICHGILHTEGLELPIDQFRIVKRKDLIKGFQIRNNCKKCESKHESLRHKSNPEAYKKHYNKHLKTKQFRITRNKTVKKYRNNHFEHTRLLNKKHCKLRTFRITEGYLKQILKSEGIINISKYILDAKKEQLLIHRKCINNRQLIKTRKHASIKTS